MKNLKLILSTCISALALCSCSNDRYYQVYEVGSDELQQTDNALIYSNNEVAVSYNFWAEGGTVTFMFENKTDNNIFIDMPKSFYIQNGIAYDYYSETTNTNSVTNQFLSSSNSSSTIYGSIYNNGRWYPGSVTRSGYVGTTTAMTKSSSTKEPMYIIVPPHSAKKIPGYSIFNKVKYDCEHRSENTPKRESQIVRFDKEFSPLVFRNRIAYSTTENDPNPSYIDNEFYVESFRNYSYKAAKKKVKTSNNCLSPIKTITSEFIISAPNRFYNKYRVQ